MGSEAFYIVIEDGISSHYRQGIVLQKQILILSTVTYEGMFVSFV